MKKAVVVSIVRSSVGKYAGQWANFPPENLAAETIKEAVKRAGVDPAEVEDVIMGNIHGLHGNIARVAALYAGLPIECGAATIDRQCGSGTQAIAYAALNVAAGMGDVYVACGMESMTQSPWQMYKPRTAFQYDFPTFAKAIGAPVEEFGDMRMPQTVDKLAKIKNISRKDCDEYAYMSHMRASRAQKAGVFEDEIVPIAVPGRKGAVTIVKDDECIRHDTTLEAMQKLPPLYEGGVTTAANSCPRSDGAAAAVIMSEERAKAMGLEPMAYVKTFAVVGLDPTIMGYGPVPAVNKVLKRSGLRISDIDCIELNEAFAGQVLACVRDLGLDLEKVNPNGGAIALGHPLGGTGVVLATKLLYEMKKKDYQLGMVTMCIGGGQGMAMVFERV